MTPQRVLVTGGSGFIAGHCILQLLDQGYLVRATVRSLSREAAVRSVLADAGMVHDDALTFVAADLTDDAGWAAAVTGVDFVLHVASPVRPGHVEDPDELILPAREGTLRVLRAARDAGVARVVLTSAFHAVGWGHPHDDRVFTEDDWTVVDSPEVDPYGASKTLAERAAWDFVRAEGGTTELVTMLPVAVMGPVLGHDVSGSNLLVKRILDGDMPGFPDLYFPVVDVRDVAAAHILAMTAKDAAGERFLICDGPAIAMKELGAWIRADLGAAAPHVPKRSVPSFVVRAGARFNAELRHIRPELGHVRRPSHDKARDILGWRPRPARDAVVAAARSLVAKGLVR
ncbi:putative dihydrokaempferol 4-reductase [Actinacidiphila reveromycinica]|uniref:Putative dihydrokaempferol 4-reductase n=1 Tax=Actinacidiphila reveromycinica TaxID=659352 RepID=A0A7U3VS12_9ACTN|nr:aldehyde reductase [Streptomyces sp. SN-593]BBB01376.1 putative dihydrokaempferol 4-reductase [Streptomyces sp. SN-593]